VPFNVLLLPLLGGYIFITYWNRTRFHVKRYSGERLIFHAALAGVFLLSVSYVVVRILASKLPATYSAWHEQVPVTHSGTSIGALLLGITAWVPLNWFYKRPAEINRTIEVWNDYLEMLLTQALEQTHQVAVTLKTRKVYIGFVLRSFDPTYDRKYIVLLPTISGYRDEKTLSLFLTTDYTAVYQQLIAADETRLIRGVDDFQTVIPVAEIISANLFDWDAYQRFNPPPASTRVVTTPTI
jgi:hypothetical protein